MTIKTRLYLCFAALGISCMGQNLLKPDLYNPVYALKKVRTISISPLNFNMAYDEQGRLIEFYSINDRNELLRMINYDTIKKQISDKVIIYEHHQGKTRTDTFLNTVQYNELLRTLNKMTVHTEENPLLANYLKSHGQTKDTLYIHFLSAEYYEFDTVTGPDKKMVRYHVYTYDDLYRLKREEVFSPIDSFPSAIKVYEYDLAGNLGKVIERNPKFSRVCRRNYAGNMLRSISCDIKQSNNMQPSQIVYLFDKKTGLLKEETHLRRGSKKITLKYKYTTED